MPAAACYHPRDFPRQTTARGNPFPHDESGGTFMTRSSRSIAFALALAAAAVALPSAQRDVPTPQAVIGWEPCADYKLATYEQIEDYFRKLAAAVSNRMKLVEMGKTAEGRTQVLAIISSEDNIR